MSGGEDPGLAPVFSLPPAFTGVLADRAERLMAARAPDFVIGGGRPYLRRWIEGKAGVGGAVTGAYVHQFVRDDDDRALHDHPWPSLSILLTGVAVEVYAPPGTDPRDAGLHRRRTIAPGDVVFRGPDFAHRIELPAGPAVTLFLTGERMRDWGFWCPQGWRHWRDFVAAGDAGAVGRGCGE